MHWTEKIAITVCLIGFWTGLIFLFTVGNIPIN